MHLQAPRLFLLLLVLPLALIRPARLQSSPASLSLYVHIAENTTVGTVLLNLSQAVAHALSRMQHAPSHTLASAFSDCRLDFSLLTDDATPSSEQRFVLRYNEEPAAIGAGADTSLVLARSVDVDAIAAAKGGPPAGAHVFELEVLLETSGRRAATATAPTASAASCRTGALLPHTVRVFVNVSDVNDNAPRFTTAPDALTVAFNEADVNGTRVPLPHANDPDAGSNSVVSYSLRVDPRSEEAALFRLQVVPAAQPKSGPPTPTPTPYLILIGRLDRERRDRYSVTLVAADGGGLTGEAVVTVRVEDANDNAPLFEKAVYSVHVPESLAVGQELVTVRATDPDIETLVGGETAGGLLYAVKPTSVPLSTAKACGSSAAVAASSSSQKGGEVSTAALVEFDRERPGRLLLRAPLDHELHPRFDVLVTATDRGTPALTATATVRIEVRCCSAPTPTSALLYSTV